MNIHDRLPFEYPCPDTSANSVIKCLRCFFAPFCFPSIYPFRLKNTVHIGTTYSNPLFAEKLPSQTTPDRHRKAMDSAKNIMKLFRKLFRWLLRIECARSLTGNPPLPESLETIRTLLCAATNTTPHERFLPYKFSKEKDFVFF